MICMTKLLSILSNIYIQIEIQEEIYYKIPNNKMETNYSTKNSQMNHFTSIQGTLLRVKGNEVVVSFTS